MISVSGKVLWVTLTSRSCPPTSGSAGTLFGMVWTFALGPVLLKRLQTVHGAGPWTLSADRSVYALWPLAAGCHTIDYYYCYYYQEITSLHVQELVC